MTSAKPFTDVRLVGIRRGVRDAERCAAFFAWLLGIEPETTGTGFCVPCANGDFIIQPGPSAPIAIELGTESSQFEGPDPDGVPIIACNQQVEARTGGIRLDHISVVCKDLNETIDYRELGLVLTWSASPPDYEKPIHGYHQQPVAGADWVHVSSTDGYLALMQADWQDYGVHNANSGPPRFIHVGFEVPDIAAIAGRLEGAGIAYTLAPRDALGERLYLNDPDGLALLGSNVELIQHVAGVPRSGKPPY